MGKQSENMAQAPGEWLGLLKWSLAYSDGTGESTAQEMAPEKREWLEAAMKELVVDEAQLSKDCVDELVELSASDELGEDKLSRVDELFEQVEDIVESLDSALNLIKMGSMAKMVELLRSPHPAFRIGAAQIIAAVAQNNPQCQAGLLQLGALAYATHISVHDTDPTARLKALLAVSCLIRNCQQGERAFVDQGDGILVLLNGLTATQPRFVAKSVHLLSFLLSEDAILRDGTTLTRHIHIFRTGGGEALVEGLIGHEDINARHGALELLQKVHLSPRPELRAKLEARTEELNQEEDADEINTIQGILLGWPLGANAEE